MTRIKYELPMGERVEIGSYYGDDGAFTSDGKKAATWIDDDTGFTIQLRGKGLTFENGVLVSGTVTKLIFEDVEHLEYATITGTINAKKLSGLGDISVEDVIEKISSGNDKIIGTANDDYLEGHAGKDVMLGGAGSDILWGGPGKDWMTGGAGSDYFYYDGPSDFSIGDGVAIITDFDARGGGAEQDYLSAEADLLDIRQSGKNTIVEFADGGSFVLLNIKEKFVTADDFDFPVNL